MGKKSRILQKPTKELREQYKSAFAPETIIGQYTFGTEKGKVAPDGYELDIFYTQKPDYAEVQSDLIFKITQMLNKTVVFFDFVIK